jgi:inner membrane protein
MPSAIGHIVAASSLGYALGNRERNGLYWFFIMLLSVLPDLDVLAFRFGIPYAHPLGHRGFFHSLLFASIAAMTPALVMYRKQGGVPAESVRLFLTFLLVGVIHPLLDAMTDGGLGIGLFIPFNNGRFFFPWRPIVVAPIGVRAFFSEWGARVLLSELIFIAVPSVLLVSVAVMIRRYAARERVKDPHQKGT